MQHTGNDVVGAVLRELREDAGLTLVEVENRTGGAIKATRLASYERGEREVSIDRLAELARFYKVGLHHLVAVIETRSAMEPAA